MKLIGKKGPALGCEWTLRNRRAVIGRDSSCDIFLDDPKTSRFHAEIVRRDDEVLLIDNGSTNGSFIEGMRVTEGVLREGQLIKIGNSEMLILNVEPEDDFEWDETVSNVMATVPLTALRESAEMARPQLEADLARMANENQTELKLDGRRLRSLHKLVQHLGTIYDLSSLLGTMMSRDQLLHSVIDRITEIFPQSERTCILMREPTPEDEKKEKDEGDDSDSDMSAGETGAKPPKKPKRDEYAPAVVRQKDRTITGEFRISRSIVRQALDDGVGILATDAQSDDRFQAADSIVNMQLKSAMCAPMFVKGEPIGAIYVDNCTQPFCFDKDDVELLGALANQAAIAIRNAQLYDDIQRSYHQAILALINTIEAKDPYTMGHTQRVMRYALGIAKHMGLSPHDLRVLRDAAQLHDIGKIGVRETVLQKPGSLTDDEYSDMQAHVVIGCRILEPIDYLQEVVPIVRGHHERYDGTGYPDGLGGEDIPLGARVLALADAFDAMTTQRPYNKPLSLPQALERCREVSGKHFDPACVEALSDFLEESSVRRDGDSSVGRGSGSGEGLSPEALPSLS